MKDGTQRGKREGLPLQESFKPFGMETARNQYQNSGVVFPGHPEGVLNQLRISFFGQGIIASGGIKEGPSFLRRNGCLLPADSLQPPDKNRGRQPPGPRLDLSPILRTELEIEQPLEKIEIGKKDEKGLLLGGPGKFPLQGKFQTSHLPLKTRKIDLGTDPFEL